MLLLLACANLGSGQVGDPQGEVACGGSRHGGGLNFSWTEALTQESMRAAAAEAVDGNEAALLEKACEAEAEDEGGGIRATRGGRGS